MPVLCTDCDHQNYDHKQTLYFLFLAPNANENSCALDSPDIRKYFCLHFTTLDMNINSSNDGKNTSFKNWIIPHIGSNTQVH